MPRLATAGIAWPGADPSVSARDPIGRGTAVELRGAVKRFAAREVLRGLDLDIAPGSFVAVVGRSGGGKSTLLRLVAGLETADAGVVAHDGIPVAGLAPRMTVMFQDPRLLPWQRVVSNVGIARHADWRRHAMEALREVGLRDRAEDWPAVLSGGQKQRVALARALVGHPSLLLLDEPLGALDALTRGEMQRLIETIWARQGFTALLVTHDVSEAVALSDRVIVLSEGAIALDQPIDLPRPRPRAATAVAALEAAILEHLLT